jgi:hypothetical protein
MDNVPLSPSDRQRSTHPARNTLTFGAQTQRPARPRYTARLKPLKSDDRALTVRAVCGRLDANCPGSLGVGELLLGMPSPRWLMFHPFKYRRDEGQGDLYHVLRPGRDEVSGRPVPRTRGNKRTNAILRVLGKRAIRGQRPILPAVIVCPKCRGENYVPVPGEDLTGGTALL